MGYNYSYLQIKSDNIFVGAFPHMYENPNQMSDSFKNTNQQNLNFKKCKDRFRKPKQSIYWQNVKGNKITRYSHCLENSTVNIL